MTIYVFLVAVIAVVAGAVLWSGAARRNREDPRVPTPDGSRDRGGLPGGGDGGFGGVSF